MIRYALQCTNDHVFEAWFASIGAYETQARRKLVVCPQCGSANVEKQVMAPALLKGGRATPEAQPEAPSVPGPADTQGMPPVDVLRAWKRHVIANSEDVGSGFAEEARKIHHGETRERAIRGETSGEDARKLADEGIPFGILPVLPEDQN